MAGEPRSSPPRAARPRTSMSQVTARILVADHRGTELRSRAAFLEARPYELAHSGSLRETVRQIAAFRPGVILLDPLTRSGAEELEALDLARGEVPILMLCEREDRGAHLRVARALGAGAFDLVFGDAPDEELEQRLGRLLDQARILREMGELRHSASHDDRTDLLRPKAFQARLVEHFSASRIADLAHDRPAGLGQPARHGDYHPGGPRPAHPDHGNTGLTRTT